MSADGPKQGMRIIGRRNGRRRKWEAYEERRWAARSGPVTVRRIDDPPPGAGRPTPAPGQAQAGEHRQ